LATHFHRAVSYIFFVFAGFYDRKSAILIEIYVQSISSSGKVPEYVDLYMLWYDIHSNWVSTRWLWSV